ncbi:hypothetical protein BH10BAC6_BH10BAC6_12230 [soil metagenome]
MVMKATLRLLVFTILMSATSLGLFAQFPSMQYYRTYDKDGLNVYETTKEDVVKFDGMKLRFGAGFTQGFQMLTTKNGAFDGTNVLTGVDRTTLPNWKKYNAGKDSIDANVPYSTTGGFNNAAANLMIDAQLADGVRLNLALYLSSRHHQETWVKGGYIQFDKLAFLGSEFIDNVMKYLTIRAGHMEINYGDAHFRRSDGGATIYNPFIENYLVDAFTTEIGADVTFQHAGFLGVVGVTNGEIKGSIDPIAPTAADKDTSRSPAIYFKAGYDTKFGDDGRIRITGSGYMDPSSASNTLFWGDRTGSNYWLTMESQAANYSPTATSASAMKPSSSSQAWSGRVNPGFSDKVTSFMFNGTFQLGGLEFFGTFETASGRSAQETADRSMSQIAADLIFRFGSTNNLYVAGRYNTVGVQLAGFKDASGAQTKQTVDRIAIAAGWFLTKNIELKGEYVMQSYKDFPTTDLRNAGKINGIVVQAVVGF